MTSIHERIRSDIEKRIMGGELGPGDRLPIEAELMEEYGCSRMTVNKAISALSAAGLVERRRKAGSFVAQPQAHAMVLDIPDLAKEVRERGQEYRFRLIHREIGEAESFDLSLPEPPGKSPILGVSLLTVGVHTVDAKPFAFESRAVSLKVVPEIDEAAFDPESPGSWLLEHVPWTEAATNISAAGANELEARYLQISEGTPCLVLARSTWRGSDHITAVRQLFVGDSYSLDARFGASRK
jgi:GntR family transcriptional regulator, histidine utilization repressor